MNAGQYTERVELLDPRNTKNTVTGQDVVYYATNDPDATCWASIEPLTSKELEAFGQVIGEANYKIRLRNYQDMGYEWVIVDKADDTVYQVTGFVQGDNEVIVFAKQQTDVNQLDLREIE